MWFLPAFFKQSPPRYHCHQATDLGVNSSNMFRESNVYPLELPLNDFGQKEEGSHVQVTTF
jgi:hypothetical protein